MAYVVQLSNGLVRLYPSREAAVAHEATMPAGIVAGCEINAANHWRGCVPTKGVTFEPTDKSYRQLLAALANYE
jgi:hypothetical protein